MVGLNIPKSDVGVDMSPITSNVQKVGNNSVKNSFQDVLNMLGPGKGSTQLLRTNLQESLKQVNKLDMPAEAKNTLRDTLIKSTTNMYMQKKNTDAGYVANLIKGFVDTMKTLRQTISQG